MNKIQILMIKVYLKTAKFKQTQPNKLIMSQRNIIIKK